MTTTISVALCADKNIEVGLHITLYSLLESSHHPIKINLVQKGYSSTDIDNIHKTLKNFHREYKLNTIDFDEYSLFGRYKGLHGSQFSFTKLMLASLLQQEERVIYIDSDLVIKKDLTSLFSENLNGHVLGVSGVSTIQSAFENKFFTSIGMKPEAKYFNSGVMLMDLEKWRQLDITKQCLKFANKYANVFTFADQAILNYVFYENNFHELDKSYNHALYPNSETIPIEDTDSIFHFVGSPKPWDFLGEVIHQNYSLSQHILSKTVFKDYKTYLDFSIHKAKRTVRLSRSYYNCLKQRLDKYDLN
jgi:UDP-glucose:(galactosyl)LPS alpha-1,2-glucosyltransferase